MFIARDGTKFVLAPWRARRLLSRLRALRNVRRGGGSATPSALLRDLREIVRHARPVRTSPSASSAPFGTQAYEARGRRGTYRLLTEPGGGYASLLNLVLLNRSETEVPSPWPGEIRLTWRLPTPIPMSAALSRARTLPPAGYLYVLYREEDPFYVGKTGDLPKRLGHHSQALNRYCPPSSVRVCAATVPGGGAAIEAAEHALVRTLLRLGFKLTNIPLSKPWAGRPGPLVVADILPSSLIDRLKAEYETWRRLKPTDRGAWLKTGRNMKTWLSLMQRNAISLGPSEVYELPAE